MRHPAIRVCSLIVGVAALAAMAGCATTPPPPRPDRDSAVACFWSSSVSNWQALDDRTLLVWTTSRKRAYRLELVMPIFALRSEVMLALVDRNHDGQICSFGRDGVLTENCHGGAVSIASIDYLSEARTKELTRGQKVKADKRKPLQCTPEDTVEAPPK